MNHDGVVGKSQSQIAGEVISHFLSRTMQVHANDALHEEAEKDASEVDDGNSGTKQECSSRGPSIKLLPATTSTARYLRKFLTIAC